MIQPKKIDTKARDEAAAMQKTINNEWQTFSKTHAYKDLMEYMDAQLEMLLGQAENMQMPHPNGKGLMPIDGKMSNLLLQNRRGVNIVRTYIRLRSE